MTPTVAKTHARPISSRVNSVRDAEEAEIDGLARIWHDAWNDAHAQIVPAELTRLRTLESFRERLQAELPNIRVAGSSGAPVGFCIVKSDELYQLFVSAEARGSGVAAALLADAEARLSKAGVEVAWLACAIGNERAARFYEKCGWHRTGIVVNHLETPSRTFLLDVWRYEKRLKSPVEHSS
jgi:ribosomal protein S18 acetylase RimI-like enzyme